MSFTEKQRRAGIAVKEAPVQQDEPTGDFIFYTVKSGDTLWNIAQKFPGVTDTEIARINNLKAGERINPGQVLRIRRKS
jgi:membrane-bound lytic murein transglycosylase D